jgi:hypothetical protein
MPRGQAAKELSTGTCRGTHRVAAAKRHVLHASGRGKRGRGGGRPGIPAVPATRGTDASPANAPPPEPRPSEHGLEDGRRPRTSGVRSHRLPRLPRRARGGLAAAGGVAAGARALAAAAGSGRRAAAAQNQAGAPTRPRQGVGRGGSQRCAGGSHAGRILVAEISTSRGGQAADYRARTLSASPLGSSVRCDVSIATGLSGTLRTKR